MVNGNDIIEHMQSCQECHKLEEKKYQIDSEQLDCYNNTQVSKAEALGE